MSLDHLLQKPSLVSGLPASHVEASERLKYAIENRVPGVISGVSGTGKSRLLHRLHQELQLNGQQGTYWDLTGWQGNEFPQLLAVRLGLAQSPEISQISAWARLDEWCCSLSELHHRQILLMDHLQRSQNCEVPLDRWLTMTTGAVPVLMAVTLPFADSWQDVLRRHCPLRIDLPKLNRAETREYMAQSAFPVRYLSPNAVSAVQQLSRGRLRSIDRVAHVADLAAEEHDLELIHEQLIRDSAQEVRL